MLVSHYQETEKDDPSRISEEAMLDSLFHACDTEHSGRVSVSKLIDYLRNAISNGSEEVRLILCSTLLFSFAFERHILGVFTFTLSWFQALEN